MGEYFLLLNERKTKDFLIDFRRKADPVQQLSLYGALIERVRSFR